MEQVYQFDFVHDTQAVFRELLSAMAHPMSVRSIAKQAAGFSWDHPELWALGCTLLDNETSFCVEMDAELEKGLAALTLARREKTREADYIFLSAPLNYDIVKILFETAKQGTLADPQRSAFFLIGCGALEESVTSNAVLSVTGPGIRGSRTLAVSPYINRICQLRSDLEMEFPCGIDLVFVDGQGRLMALPRLCKTVEI